MNGDWEETETELYDWVAHPELSVPEAVARAAEGLGWPDPSEIVQGEDYFNEQDAASEEGSEDSQTEDALEDDPEPAFIVLDSGQGNNSIG